MDFGALLAFFWTRNVSYEIVDFVDYLWHGPIMMGLA